MLELDELVDCSCLGRHWDVEVGIGMLYRRMNPLVLHEQCHLVYCRNGVELHMGAYVHHVDPIVVKRRFLVHNLIKAADGVLVEPLLEEALGVRADLTVPSDTDLV